MGDIVSSFDAAAVRERGFRAVFDYGLSAAALVVPSVMSELGVETIARSALDGAGRHGEASEAELLGRLVVAAGADLGVRFDRSGERIWIVDEQARPLSGARLLLLLASLAARRGLEGVVAVPLTCTEQVEAVVEGSGISVRRTRASARRRGGRRRRGWRDLLGSRPRRLRLRPLPAGLRRRGLAVRPARAAGARDRAALGAHRRAAAPVAGTRGGRLSVVGQGRGHAGPHRGREGPRHGQPRRPAGARGRRRLGAAACRTPTARSSTSSQRHRATGPRPTWPAATATVSPSWSRRTSPNPKAQREGAAVRPVDWPAWRSFPIFRPSTTPS